jgi:hypothetical protein
MGPIVLGRLSAADIFDYERSVHKAVSEFLCQRERFERRDAGVGALIMLGALLGLIVLIFGVVVYFDPEARPSKECSR